MLAISPSPLCFIVPAEVASTESPPIGAAALATTPPFISPRAGPGAAADWEARGCGVEPAFAIAGVGVG